MNDGGIMNNQSLQKNIVTTASISRRKFVQRSAAGIVGLTSFSRPSIVHGQTAGGDKLRVAVIGVAGLMGGYSIDCALREHLVAIVDVDENYIATVMNGKVKDTARPKIFHDYRRMLEQCHNEIDVVLIATPDHHHAPAAMRAMSEGKHVFCQKPLGHNIAECYAMAKMAREKKVLTQMGNQGYCGEHIRRVSEYIAAGAIGDVVETHTLLCRNWGGAGGRPETRPVPAGLHWDEWLGPAPVRGYHEQLHPFHWRGWRHFGTGTIGDMACHHLAVPFMALKLWEYRTFTVECISTSEGSDEKYPTHNIVCYHFPAGEGRVARKCYLYDDSEMRPAVMRELEQKYTIKWGESTVFVGTKGYLNNYSRIIPEEQHQKFPPPPKTLPRPLAGAPIEDLFACIRKGAMPVSNFTDAAGPLTAMALTGHLSQTAGAGAKIEWNVDKMQCTNRPDLNRLLKREYRASWEI